MLLDRKVNRIKSGPAMLSQVVELIEKKDRFAITSHIRPDGDGLGSSLGLFWLLQALNKEVEVIMRDPAPHAYQQLPGADTIRVVANVDRDLRRHFRHRMFGYRSARTGRIWTNSLSSISIITRPRNCSARLTGSTRPPPPCGEMIYNLCKATGVRVTKEIAECVYTALLTDTGSFHYSNTTERDF